MVRALFHKIARAARVAPGAGSGHLCRSHTHTQREVELKALRAKRIQSASSFGTCFCCSFTFAAAAGGEKKHARFCWSRQHEVIRVARAFTRLQLNAHTQHTQHSAHTSNKSNKRTNEKAFANEICDARSAYCGLFFHYQHQSLQPHNLQPTTHTHTQKPTNENGTNNNTWIQHTHRLKITTQNEQN